MSDHDLWSGTAAVVRLSLQRGHFHRHLCGPALKMPAVARRTATASGCSGGSDSTSDSTCRQSLSWSGSIEITVDGYGLHASLLQTGDPLLQHPREKTGLPVIETDVPAAVWPLLRGVDNLVDHSRRGTWSHP